MCKLHYCTLFSRDEMNLVALFLICLFRAIILYLCFILVNIFNHLFVVAPPKAFYVSVCSCKQQLLILIWNLF